VFNSVARKEKENLCHYNLLGSGIEIALLTFLLQLNKGLNKFFGKNLNWGEITFFLLEFIAARENY